MFAQLLDSSDFTVIVFWTPKCGVGLQRDIPLPVYCVYCEPGYSILLSLSICDYVRFVIVFLVKLLPTQLYNGQF